MAPTSHPGEVKMVDMFTHESRLIPVSSVPEDRRFVYMKDGVEVSRDADATSSIPIVEVQMFPIDEEGHLVSKEMAKTIRIIELGPDGRVLRSTLMVPK